jgi:hypothetical protein
MYALPGNNAQLNILIYVFSPLYKKYFDVLEQIVLSRHEPQCSPYP